MLWLPFGRLSAKTMTESFSNVPTLRGASPSISTVKCPLLGFTCMAIDVPVKLALICTPGYVKTGASGFRKLTLPVYTISGE